MHDRGNTYTPKEEKASTAHVIWDVFLSVFIASSPRNLVRDLQGRYTALFSHTASDQKQEVGKA